MNDKAINIFPTLGRCQPLVIKILYQKKEIIYIYIYNSSFPSEADVQPIHRVQEG